MELCTAFGDPAPIQIYPSEAPPCRGRTSGFVRSHFRPVWSTRTQKGKRVRRFRRQEISMNRRGLSTTNECTELCLL
jgi:hypothetical protein